MRGVSKVFLTRTIETRALSNVSLEIESGEFVLIRGPSGCGKSTLLALMGLLDTPTSGEYLLEGKDTKKMGLVERARLRNRTFGFVFQSFHLIHDMTICENVELPLLYRRNLSKAQRLATTMNLLENLGIAHRAQHYPAQLSGGQQQRAALARAMIGEPSLLLADEPTGNLDAAAEDAIIGLLGDLHAKGGTICVVSHSPNYLAVADRQLALSEGRLAQHQCADRHLAFKPPQDDKVRDDAEYQDTNAYWNQKPELEQNRKGG